MVSVFRHGRDTAKIGYEENEYGTLVSRHRCRWCGEEFTICPAVTDDKDNQWTGCQSNACESYDPKRDVDQLFEEGSDKIIRGPVLSLNAKK
jgi:hypothetical protein